MGGDDGPALFMPFTQTWRALLFGASSPRKGDLAVLPARTGGHPGPDPEAGNCARILTES